MSRFITYMNACIYFICGVLHQEVGVQLAEAVSVETEFTYQVGGEHL